MNVTGTLTQAQVRAWWLKWFPEKTLRCLTSAAEINAAEREGYGKHHFW